MKKFSISRGFKLMVGGDLKDFMVTLHPRSRNQDLTVFSITTFLLLDNFIVDRVSGLNPHRNELAAQEDISSSSFL